MPDTQAPQYIRNRVADFICPTDSIANYQQGYPRHEAEEIRAGRGDDHELVRLVERCVGPVADEGQSDLTCCPACGALPCDQVTDPFLMLSEAVMLGYAMHYGSRCRDCADEDGICPQTGMPCDGREEATRFVCGALAYGFRHGFIDPQYAYTNGHELTDPPAPPSPSGYERGLEDARQVALGAVISGNDQWCAGADHTARKIAERILAIQKDPAR